MTVTVFRASCIEELTLGFAEWLRTERVRRGFTLASLAERADVEPSTIQRLETGARGSRRPMVERVARALVPDNASNEEAQSIIADGLIAAGFVPNASGDGDQLDSATVEMVREMGLDGLPQTEGYNYLDSTDKQELGAMYDALLKAKIEQRRKFNIGSTDVTEGRDR